VVSAAWAFVFTFFILKAINCLPFMRLKLTPEEEELGTDWVTLGEVACNYHFLLKIFYTTIYYLLTFYKMVTM
jgi:ammonia channel protein AmtB